MSEIYYKNLQLSHEKIFQDELYNTCLKIYNKNKIYFNLFLICILICILILIISNIPF